MDAKTSYILIIGLFFILISPCIQQDDNVSAQEDNDWITTNWITIKADDWIKTDDLTKAKPYYVKLFPEGTLDSLKFNPELFKLKPDGNDPVKFSMKYWISKNSKGFEFFNHRTKKIYLDPNHSDEFVTNKDFTQTKFTFNDLIESELIPAFGTEDSIILLQDITVNYTDFQNLTTNFDDKNNKMEFSLLNKNEWGQIQQVFEKDQFDEICIETNLDHFQIYLSMENDNYVKPISSAYNEDFKKQKGICLKEIFYINPNGRFMIIVKVQEQPTTDPKKDYSLKFHLKNAKTIDDFDDTKDPDDDTIPFNKWIYKINLKGIYDFELKSPEPTAKFYACDSMATCFDYKPDSNSLKFTLKNDDWELLRSPIIKRIAIPHDPEPKLEGSFKDKFLHKLLDGQSWTVLNGQGKATFTIHQSSSPDALQDLFIPYIDLRLYEPTIQFDPSIIVKSISITPKSNAKDHISGISFHPSMKEFVTDNTINLGQFFHPRIGDDFNNYQFVFSLRATEDNKPVVIDLGDKKNPSNIVVDGCATDGTKKQTCLKESKWIMAPITPGPKSIGIGNAVFELDGTATNQEEIEIKHQIQFYDGSGTEPAKDPKKFTNTEKIIQYPIEADIKGPYKVFYWITLPEGVTFKNYSDTFQDIHNKNEEQIKKGPTNKWYDPEHDPIDDSACPTGFEWNKSKQQCLLIEDDDPTKNHLSTTMKCNENNGCLNIFEKPLLYSKLYSDGSKLQLIGEVKFNGFGISKLLIPFVDPNNLTNQVSIPKKAKDAGKDLCISFKHFGSKSKLYAFVESNPEYEICFEDDETSMKENKGLFSEDSICASDLSPEPDQIKSIVLKFDNDPKLSKPLDQSIAEIDRTGSTQNSIKGIMQDDDKKLENFFSSRYDKKFFDEESGNIKFSLSKTQLAPEQVKFQRILSTKFLPLYKDGKDKIMDIGLTYSGDFIDLGGEVWIQFRPESKSKSKSKYSIKDWENEPMKHLIYDSNDIDPSIEYVQVQFVFQIANLTEMKEKMNETHFSINDLSINDPCVGEQNSLTDFCSHLPDACERHNEIDGKTNRWIKWHKCNCSVNNSFRTGDDCQYVDYCQRDNKIDYCLKNHFGNCKNDYKKNSWHCDCGEGRTWIPIGESCSKKIDKDFECPEKEIIQIKDLETPECVCEDGYVRINKECVEFDVCNVEHRKANGLIPEQPCSDQYAECSKTSSAEYQCICKDDLTNDAGNFQKDAKCIDQLCNLNLKCEQMCQPNSTDVGQSKCQCFNEKYEMDQEQKHCKIKAKYELQEKDCLPSQDVENLSVFERAYLVKDGKCGCKLNGYKFNSTSKKCEPEPDKDFVKKILHCEQIKLNEDGQPECVCPTGQEYNHELGKCSYEHCPQPDQIRFIADPEHPEKSKCLDACDENLIQKCEDDFARCQKEKVIKKFRELIPNENDVLVFINGTNQKVNQTDHCDCIVGFKMDSGKCHTDVSKSMMTIEISFINTKDKQQTKNYLEKILQQTFEQQQQSVSLESINCEDNGFCQVSMLAETALKPETVKQIIENQCVDENDLKNNVGQSENCVYILKNDPNSNNFMIALSKSKSASIKCENDRCFSDPCKSFKHTKCVADSKQDKFSCQCIDDMYWVINTKQEIKGDIQICKLPNCQEKGVHCDDPTAKCFILDPRDDDYDHYDDADILSLFTRKPRMIQDGNVYVRQICICDDGYILPNISGKCDEHKNCDLDCHQHGKCYFLNNDQKICRCNEKWTGDLCEKEIEDKHDHDDDDTKKVDSPNSDGFKISTIVLAVLSALLVVGVVYLFMKK